VSEDDDGTLELVDELHMLFIDCQHSEMEKAEASQLTQEERQERIDTVVAEVQEETGQPVEIANLDELLSSEVKGVEKTEESQTVIDKGSFLEDILKKYGEHIDKPANGEQQKEKGH
jgi:hypothetical protein